jgi:transcriptional regulator with XRE-family HTH domain
VIAGDGDARDQLGVRRRLAAELRRVRDLAGISGRELAQRVGISQSKVSRIESGTAIPSWPEVTAWADATEASDETRNLLGTLTEAAFTEVHTWHSVLQQQTHLQGDIQDLENGARRILTFQHSVIPGLLQTAEYARRMFTLFEPPYVERDIPAVLAARLDRQTALFEEGRRFDFLITEAALRWRPGPPRLLLAQFDRIASLSSLENLSIGLIPQDVEAITNTSHAFVILEFAETRKERDAEVAPSNDKRDHYGVGDADPGTSCDAIVTIETVHANLTVTDPESVALYKTRWSMLERMAVFGDEARTFLASVASDIRMEGG